MRQANSESCGLPAIPWARLAALTAPGPSCKRQEHLDDIINGAGRSQRRRLTRALDELTVRWATNRLSHACRWMLNTQVLFLKKEKEPTCNEFDDNEWLRTLPDEAIDGEWLQDVPEADVAAVGP